MQQLITLSVCFNPIARVVISSTMATRQARYKPVSSRNNDAEQSIEFTSVNNNVLDGEGDYDDATSPNDGLRTSLDADTDIDADDSPSNPSSMLFYSKDVHPMEIVSSESYDGCPHQRLLFTWQDPCTILLILILQVPVLLGNVWIFYNLIGAWFVATPFVLHLLAMLLTIRHVMSKQEEQESNSFGFVVLSRIWTSFACITDISLLGFAYPFVWRILIDHLFTDVDGTIVVEWSQLASQLEVYMILAKTAAMLRCLLGINAIGLFLAVSCSSVAVASSLDELSTVTWCGRCCSCLHNSFLRPFLHVNNHLENKTRRLCSVWSRRKTILKRYLFWFVNSAIALTAVLFMCCLYSSFRHLLTFQPPNKISNPDCDGLDDTECWLPFPSFHVLQADSTTATGWRVHLEGKLLPPLKSGMNIHAGFLNKLDGFSTMAPMMFYLPGLKEAHQAATEARGGGGGGVQLKGWQNIAESITSQSATLLLDVVSRRLLPHSAEIDYLDDQHPLVLLFPARPLDHNRHYAVALVNATDERGHRLAPTPGMKKILHAGTTTSTFDANRTSRYLSELIPALQEAADWIDYSSDPASLQLLFDFHTISEESQLGPVRAVRDATMEEISSTDWNWNDHVQTIQQIDYDDCSSQSNARLARTVHAELDVPWFLEKHGPGARNSFLDQKAVDSGKAMRLGKSKFLVHIPCSVRASALGEENKGAAKLSAIMEYGHGLFGTRAEAWDDFLVDMAQKEGFIITAMDWRGMSTFDLLMVAKVLVSTPRHFQAVRDNLIQGYACKYALQHFSRHAMLSMDWFRFDDSSGRDLSRSMQALADAKPSYVFYGISQGGILGAGYTALSGVTGLIDRAVLGSPGTPFALVMSRSLDFLPYDKLLMFDFYYNRHVRMLLSLVQMAWDSVEGSGVLAPPINEPYPRVLIQAGLGDVIVPTLASEALARAFNASLLPNGPRKVFGISEVVLSSAETTSNNDDDGPYATITEVMYDQQLQGLPLDNTAAQRNDIHICLRRDKAMIKQVSQFLSTGKVIDPCIEDGCHRFRIEC